MGVYPWSVLKASFVLIAMLCPGNDNLHASEWKDRFLTDGVPRLRELEQLTFWLQATIQEVETSQGAKLEAVRECCFQGPWQVDVCKRKYAWDMISPSKRAHIPVEIVFGTNSRYYFGLTRPKDGRFTIASIQEIGKRSSILGPYGGPSAQSLSASWILDLQPFHEWLKTDGFRVETVEPTVSSDGKGRVQVKIKYDAGGKKSIREPIESFAADVLVNPDDHWCICGVNYLYKLKDNAGSFTFSKRVTVEYQHRIDGMPVPGIVTEFREMKDRAPAGTVKSVISELQKTGTLGEDQFMLSRFGLPEPKQPLKRIALILFGLCFLATVLALWLRRFVTKRRKNSRSDGSM